MSIRRGYPLVALLLVLIAGCATQAGEVSDSALEAQAWPILESAAEVVAIVIEILGITVIVKGAVTASIAFMKDWIGELKALVACRDYREQLGYAVLLGLEYLVAADIIRTVAVRPTFRNVGILGAIVAIRTFLSFALEVEIEGRLPWKAGGN
ncbi:MAG: DUF1622 domain-containing protein [Chloroflexota bacterium]